MTHSKKFIPLSQYKEYPEEEMIRRSADYYAFIRQRRTVRDFSDRPVPREIIEQCLLAAGTAPNGANMQPWHFVVVSDAEVKRVIRESAEAEERAFYNERAPDEWLEALAPLGTSAEKPFLEIALKTLLSFPTEIGLVSSSKYPWLDNLNNTLKVL